MGKKESEEDVSGKIVVVLVIILILTVILGSWTILNTISANTIIKNSDQQPAKVAITIAAHPKEAVKEAGT